MLFILAYTKSLFGHEGRNTVMDQQGDSFEILGTVPTPQNVKSILEAPAGKYSNPPIKNEQEYPWLGHGYRCAKESLDTEIQKMKIDFCKNRPDLTQDQAYAHPAALKQFVTDKNLIEEIKKAPRLKGKVWMNTRIQSPHWTSFYAMPGEVVTIEIPEFALNKLRVTMNRQARETKHKTKNRYPNVECWFQLTTKVNKFAYPLGGSIDIELDRTFNEGLEINISGAIRMPHFRYGTNTDKEWEEELRNYKAPLAVVDSGAIVNLFPGDRVKNKIRLNDACGFWRTVSQIFYSVNEVPNYDRYRDNRIKHEMKFNFDSYVAVGAAYSVQGANFIQAPPGWADQMMSYVSAIKGCWGNVHEYGHQFQKNWGISGTGETTNNVLNFITYSLITEIDASRQTNMANQFLFEGGGWNRITHEFNMMNAFGGYDGPLTWYGNMVYYFGHIKWRQCLHAHIRQTFYKRAAPLSYESEFVLHCAKFFKRDLRKYFLSFDFIKPAMITAECNNQMEKLKLKEFHPVTNIYAVGYKIDRGQEGVEEFETHKPYAIPARNPYYFDFQKTMKTRQKMNDFECVRAYGGQGKLEKITGCKYIYTPTSNTSIVDKFYVEYKDKNLGDITTVVVKVKQIFKGCRMSFMKLPKGTYANAAAADTAYYNNLGNRGKKLIPAILRGDNGIKIWKYSAHDQLTPWVGVAEGVFIPRRTGVHRFGFKHSQDCVFYFTENKLTGDPSKDKSYIIATRANSEGKYADNSKEKAINLTKGKSYNFRFVVLAKSAGGYGTVGYKFEKHNYVDVPANEVFYPDCKADDVDMNPFVPRFEQDPTLGKYYDNRNLKYDKSGWKLTAHPTPKNAQSNLQKLLFDGGTGGNTECTGSFPLKYSIDFGEETSFTELELPMMGNRQMISNIEVYCDGTKFGNFSIKAGSVKHNFKKAMRCKTMDIKVLDNKKGNYASFTEINLISPISTSQNIIPATHEAFSVSDTKKCVLTRSGLYYNGRGWKLPSGCSLKISVPLNETGNSIGIVGDRSNLHGGVFEVYLDGKYHGKCDTTKFVNSEYIKAGQTMYQQPLYGIIGLKKQTSYDVEIRVKSGQIGIAGLLASTDITINETSNAEGGFVKPGDNAKLAYIVNMIIVALTILAVLAAIIGIIVMKCKEPKELSEDIGVAGQVEEEHHYEAPTYYKEERYGVENDEINENLNDGSN